MIGRTLRRLARTLSRVADVFDPQRDLTMETLADRLARLERRHENLCALVPDGPTCDGACSVCEQRSLRCVGEHSYMTGTTPESWAIVHCTDCGATYPRPKATEAQS